MWVGVYAIDSMSISVHNNRRRNAIMAKEFRARFSHGVLEPLDAVDLKEGEEVKVIIAERPKGQGMIEALRASAGGWKGLIDAEELKRNIYADRLISTRLEPKL
jgi:predicted DNA-binding antitoxin AbrB/MazE fold protein